MCEAMKRLMMDEIQEEKRDSKQEGRQEGILEILFGLVKDGIISIADAAKRANMMVSDFETAYKTSML